MQRLYFRKVSFFIPLLFFFLLSGQFLDKKIYGSESAQRGQANIALSELDEYNHQFKEWKEKERWRRKRFFSKAPYAINPSAFISKILNLKASPFVVPLNSQIRKYMALTMKGIAAARSGQIIEQIVERQQGLSSKINRSTGQGGENINAGVSLNKKLSQLEKAQSSSAKTVVLPDGRIRYYGEKIPAVYKGRTSGARRVTEFNPLTGKTRSWHECYDRNENVIRIHPKQINGQDVISPHYPKIGEELK